MKNGFLYTFKYRTTLCLAVFWMLMLFAAVRLTAVAVTTKKYSVPNISYSVELSSGRGNFYFSEGERITSSKIGQIAVFLPIKASIEAFKKIAEGDFKKEGLKKLRSNQPVAFETDRYISAPGVYYFEREKRYGDLKGLEHFIGYIDKENKGIMGLERYYNSLLFSKSKAKAEFTADALGNFLAGVKPVVASADTGGDIYLTVDKSIQSICFNAAKSIKKGCIIVVEINTGKIRGAVSKPSFDPDNAQEFVEDENSPFLNRCIEAYSVGSVFKPLVAAVMLESGKKEYHYFCNGYIDIAGRRFNCNLGSGHGNMGIREGIINSCNTYFYTGAMELEPKRLLATANSLSFGVPINIGGGIVTSAGSITDYENLKHSKAAMANFAIGQGDILVSPLQMTNLYCAIANGGVYYSPGIIEYEKVKDEYKKIDIGGKNIAFSKTTADTLKEYLKEVVVSGTGKKAYSEGIEIAGKTATAQTGRYGGEKEILNAWFCGFFPADSPKYAATVFLEDATSGGNDAAPIFKEIAEKITFLNKN